MTIVTRNEINRTPQHKSIEVLRVEPGDTPGVIAIVDVRIGGIVFRQINVCDRGRGIYVNFPRRKVNGHWLDLVEIVSPGLRKAAETVILAAVLEVVR